MTFSRSLASLTMCLSFALASNIPGNAQAQFASQAAMGMHQGFAQGYASQGQAETFSRMDRGFSRGMAFDHSGRNLSYSYAVRMGDGRIVANSHHMSIENGGSFYGSGRAMGYGRAEAGGAITSPGMGSAYGVADPSPYLPAWTQSRSHSMR